MTARPLVIEIVCPPGKKPHVRIRAKGNREPLFSSEVYADVEAAEHVVDLLIESLVVLASYEVKKVKK